MQLSAQNQIDSLKNLWQNSAEIARPLSVPVFHMHRPCGGVLSRLTHFKASLNKNPRAAIIAIFADWTGR
jgi:hypothetical protein